MMPPFTRERLARTARLFVREGLADPVLLDKAPRRATRNSKAKRAMELAASFQKRLHHATTLQRTPRAE
jgi:hypothetical protein